MWEARHDAFRHLEDDGLQVDYNKDAAPEAISHDYEIPEAVPLKQSAQPLPLKVEFSGNKGTYRGSSFAPTPIDHKNGSSRRRSGLARYRWWILGALVGLIALVAIIVGAVLGTKAAQDKQSMQNDAASSSNAGTDTGPGQDARIKSVKGAWNGTGLASVYAYEPAFWSWMFYQDYQGNIRFLQYNLTANGAPIVVGSGTVTTDAGPVKPANGTGVAVARYWGAGVKANKLQLVYVSPNNTLCNVWLPFGSVDQNGKIGNNWMDGDLYNHGFKVPTDNRPAMYMVESDLWYGDGYNNSNGASRLYVGGIDGGLHQYSFKNNPTAWSNQDYKFVDSYAYGAAFAQYGTTADGTYNTTLYTTAADGTLQYRIQTVTKDNTRWPTGGTWTTPVTGPTKLTLNSSLVAAWGAKNRVIYPTDSGGVGAVDLNLAAADSKGQWGSYDQSFQSIKMMPGTDMTHDGNQWGALVMFQRSGDDISWQYWDGGATMTGILDLP